MKKFEVPYNFDPLFVEKFGYREDLLPYIDCFYLPAWKDDCDNTRFNSTLGENYPKTYDEYDSRIKDLKSFGVPLCILMQKSATLKLIEKYIALGIKAFTLNDDKLAKRIKAKYPDVRLSLSITRVLSLADIKEPAHDFSMYDRIVLWHWFSKNIDALSELPDRYKYVLICNSGCVYNCSWHDEHWYIKADDLDDYKRQESEVCAKCDAVRRSDPDKTSIIEPEDLEFFDPYISVYKLIDRLDHTELIIDNLNAYVNRFRGCPKGRAYYNITT